MEPIADHPSSIQGARAEPVRQAPFPTPYCATGAESAAVRPLFACQPTTKTPLYDQSHESMKWDPQV